MEYQSCWWYLWLFIALKLSKCTIFLSNQRLYLNKSIIIDSLYVSVFCIWKQVYLPKKILFGFAMTNHHKIRAGPLVVEPSKSHLKVSQRFSVWYILLHHHPEQSLQCQNQPQLKHWQSKPHSIEYFNLMNHHVQDNRAYDNIVDGVKKLVRRIGKYLNCFLFEVFISFDLVFGNILSSIGDSASKV